MAEQILAGKTGVVFGVANKRSIAWAIAQAWAAAGARLIFNYQGERLKENVEELVGEFGQGTPLYPCDVSKDEEIDSFFEKVRGQTDRLDLLLHSVAFAPKEALEGDFLNTTREAFRLPTTSAPIRWWRSARAAAPLMTDGGSILAMSYYGAEKVVPHYNVMGVAKASLEASTRYLAYDLGTEENPGELHQRRAGQHARGARHQRLLLDAEALRGSRPAQAKLRAIRTRCHRFVSRQRRRGRHHRPGALRGRRLSDHGDVISARRGPTSLLAPVTIQ